MPFPRASLAAFLLLAGCSTGSNAPEPALELTGRVVDQADIFDDAFEARLTSQLARLEDEKQVQFVVASTSSLNGHVIEEYSINLARAWSLGDVDRNDGLLLLVAPNERQVRIEVGIGLVEDIKDEEAATIIQRDILPRFRSGDFESGVKNGVDGLIREVTPELLKEAA
ncbi:MAG: TPM domain-containing protein [Pseudomonadota bacterium]